MSLNCPNCGGPISVSDEYCPYCGSLNQTKEKEKVKKAESKVRTAEKKASLTIPLVLIVILIVVDLIVAAIAAGAYRSGYEKRKNINEAHADEIVAEFEGYLADRDYLMANCFYSNGDYYSLSTMKQYRMVTDALGIYASVYYSIAPERPSKYSSDGLLDSCGTIARELDSLYGLSEHSYYDYVPTKETNDLTSDISTEAETLVAAAYHLTPEETESMYRMKESEIAELLKMAYIRSAGTTTDTEDE